MRSENEDDGGTVRWVKGADWGIGDGCGTRNPGGR